MKTRSVGTKTSSKISVLSPPTTPHSVPQSIVPASSFRSSLLCRPKTSESPGASTGTAQATA